MLSLFTFSRFSRTPTCERQTDRRTDGHRAIAHIAPAQRRAVTKSIWCVSVRPRYRNYKSISQNNNLRWWVRYDNRSVERINVLQLFHAVPRCGNMKALTSQPVHVLHSHRNWLGTDNDWNNCITSYQRLACASHAGSNSRNTRVYNIGIRESFNLLFV